MKLGRVILVVLVGCHRHGESETREHKSETAHARTAEVDQHTAHGWWYGHEPLCVVDVNADGIGDVVGLVSDTDIEAIAVDGRTGLALWTRTMRSASRVSCVSDCARVVQSRGADLIISTKTGDFVSACDTSSFPTDTSEREAREAGYLVGDVKITVASGGNEAEVTATRGKTLLWRKASGVSTFPHIVTVPTSDGVFLVGTPPGDQGHLTWTLLRATTGEEAFRHNEATSSVASARNGAAFGDRGYFTAIQRVYAVDLKTGNVVWWLGHA